MADTWNKAEAESLRRTAQRIFAEHGHGWNFRDKEDENLTRSNCEACILNGYVDRDDDEAPQGAPNVAGWARAFVEAGKTIPAEYAVAFANEQDREDNPAYVDALKKSIKTFETAVENFDLDESFETSTPVVFGNVVAFAKVVPDDSPENPMDWAAQGKIYSLGSRYNNFDPDAVKDALANNPDAVALSYFEHGNSLWLIRDGATPAGVEFQWDGVKTAGVWVPDGDVLANVEHAGPVTGAERIAKLREYCAGILEVYNAWCNGEVYGYVVEVFKATRGPGGEVLETYSLYTDDQLAEDSCWGFYGIETARQEASEAVVSCIQQACAKLAELEDHRQSQAHKFAVLIEFHPNESDDETSIAQWDWQTLLDLTAPVRVLFVAKIAEDETFGMNRPEGGSKEASQ